MHWAQKKNSTKETRTISGFFTAEVSKAPPSVMQAVRQLISLPETWTLFLLEAQFCWTFPLQIAMEIFPLIFIYSSNCSTTAFQFHPPDSALKYQFSQHLPSLSLTPHWDLTSSPSFASDPRNKQLLLSCSPFFTNFCTQSHNMTSLGTTITKLSVLRSSNDYRDVPASIYLSKRTAY